MRGTIRTCIVGCFQMHSADNLAVTSCYTQIMNGIDVFIHLSQLTFLFSVPDFEISAGEVTCRPPESAANHPVSF